MKRRFIFKTELPQIKRMKRQRNNWKDESFLNTNWGHVSESEPPLVGDVNPVISLTELEIKIFEFLMGVVKKNNLNDTILRVAGGWVRDKVLGAESDDIDIAINNMTGSEFCKYVVKDMEEGKKFAVIQSNPEQSKHLETSNMTIFGQSIDFVNLRTEEYASDERIPSVMGMGTPLEDALRRDLTINSLFYNINTRTVEDFTKHGLDDLKEHLIRTPLLPLQTFLDDPLRILRCMRFASRFNFSVHEDIFVVCQTKAEVIEALKDKVSRERVGIEIKKMVKTSDPPGGFALIDELGIREVVFALSNPSKTKKKKMAKKKKKKTLMEFENPSPIAFPGNSYQVGLSRMRIMTSLLRNDEYKKKMGSSVNKLTMLLSSFFSVVTTEDSMKGFQDVTSFCENIAMTSLRYSRIVARNMSFLCFFSRRIHDYVTFQSREKVKDEDEEEEGEAEGKSESSTNEVEQIKAGYRNLIQKKKRLEIGQMIRKIGKELFYPTLVMSIVHNILTNEKNDSILTEIRGGRRVQKNMLFWDVLNEDDYFETVVRMRPLLNGKEVCEHLQIRPGRIISTILDSLINQQILNTKMTKEEAMEYITKKFGNQ